MKSGYQILSIFMVLLVIHMPVVAAVEISNVKISEVTDKQALVTWESDTPGDSFVSYGIDKNKLTLVGDANPIIEHKVALKDLKPSSTYFYSVETSGTKDDNKGSLYSFSTKDPDTKPPELEVNIPTKSPGTRYKLEGYSEFGSEVEIYVNNDKVVIQTIKEENKSKILRQGLDGYFSHEIILVPNVANDIKVVAIDKAGNKVNKSGKIFSDSTKPILKVSSFPTLISEKSVKLLVDVSEEVEYQVFLNNRSVDKGKGNKIDTSLSLNEGNNNLKIIAKDDAGWESIYEKTLKSDSKNPTLTVKVESGTEYYEGRAVSTITGTTKPGANVYIYVYRQSSIDFTPDFKKARAVVTANEKGEFTFKDVDFAALDISLKLLSPKQVPSGLQQVKIAGISGDAQQSRAVYYVYVVAEDSVFRTAYWQGTININTCSAGAVAFSITSVSKFQAPLRLNPQMMDEGRQDLQAVFDLKYIGSGVKKTDASGNEVEPAFKIISVNINKACTSSMSKDETFGLGCTILPTRSEKVENSDKSKIYAHWTLLPSKSLSKVKDDFWNDLKGRRVMFPLKIVVTYQERQADGKYSSSKVQTGCYDLGYLVDTPVESKNLIPDVLADEGVKVLNETLNTIKTVKPYIEQAYFIAGVSCMGSFISRAAVRWIRIFMSGAEVVWTATKDDDEKCPANQFDLYLKETIDNWKSVDSSKVPKKILGSDAETLKKITLDERCPQTANMWKFEAFIDQLYKWSCDRAFCRAVPAGWTQDKKIQEINEVEFKQNQCAVTGRGVALQKIENCQTFLKQNPLSLMKGLKLTDIKDNCYRTVDGALYYYFGAKTAKERSDSQKGVFTLKYVGNVQGKSKSEFKSVKDNLIVYKPQGSNDFIVGKDQTCKQVCEDKRKPGYKAVGCRAETTTKGQVSVKLNKGEYLAGYTSDCFLDNSGATPKLQQCVCVGSKQDKDLYQNSDLSLRTAVEKTATSEEKWSYRQDRIFEESKKLKGTYYPPQRYISGRDFSSAFGADYLLDYIAPANGARVTKVNPFTQYIGAFQTLCLSAVLKHLSMIEAIAGGLKNCIVQAKYTGFQDAGMCKTLFSQHVCGLVYKAIAYVAGSGQCSPSNFDDVSKGKTFSDVGKMVSQGFSAMDKSLQTSIDDLKSDYGNAKLNEYFKSGTSGFVQSMCMGALGFEFPMFSKDFLLDAAYATPTKTTPMVAPAERELSTYNPAKQTAVFNYNIGGAILAGCKIKRAIVSLRCIGPEDVGSKGVDTTCKGQGCDCLNVKGAQTSISAERTKVLHTKTDIASGSLYDIRLTSPQRVDSHYRYDHVMLELELDPSEKGNENKCFDEGYVKGNKAVFYYPIKDVSPKLQLDCKPDLTSGRFICPELYSVFGFGGAFMEEPYVSCWNKATNTYVDCTTPNLFTLGDQIKVQIHLQTDGKAKCIKRTVSNVAGIAQTSAPVSVPANVAGPLTIRQTLGTVTEQMFGGLVNTIFKTTDSNPQCNPTIVKKPTTVKRGEKFQFVYTAKGNTIQLKVPTNAQIDASDTTTRTYSLAADRTLQIGTKKDLTIDEVNKVQFIIGGFAVKKILGNAKPNDQKKVCIYQLSDQSSFSQANARDISVTYDLLEKGEGTCSFAKNLVKASSGKNRHTQTIRIQKAPVAFQSATGIHASFILANYATVHSLTLDIIKEKQGNLANAQAVYYDVASLIKEGEKAKDVKKYQTEISNLLAIFFERKYGGEGIPAYTAEVVNSGEYKKIFKYLCEVDKYYSKKYQTDQYCNKK